MNLRSADRSHLQGFEVPRYERSLIFPRYSLSIGTDVGGNDTKFTYVNGQGVAVACGAGEVVVAIFHEVACHCELDSARVLREL